MTDVIQLERAKERLLKDPSLPSKLLNEIHAAYAAARHAVADDVPADGPPAFFRLDGQLRADLSLSSAIVDTGEQLLCIEHMLANWLRTCAEATGAKQARVDRERAAAHAARMAPLAEASRSDWAERTGGPVLSGVAAFVGASAAISQRIRARPFGDEAALVAALDELAGEIRLLNSAISAVRRESKTRSEAADAVRVVDSVMSLARAA